MRVLNCVTASHRKSNRISHRQRAVHICGEGLLWYLPADSRQVWEQRLGEVAEEKGGGGL